MQFSPILIQSDLVYAEGADRRVNDTIGHRRRRGPVKTLEAGRG